MEDTSEWFRFMGWQLKTLLEREGFPIDDRSGPPPLEGTIDDMTSLPTRQAMPTWSSLESTNDLEGAA